MDNTAFPATEVKYRHRSMSVTSFWEGDLYAVEVAKEGRPQYRATFYALTPEGAQRRIDHAIEVAKLYPNP